MTEQRASYVRISILVVFFILSIVVAIAAGGKE
jgi:hypothetical protein